ncbi:unnamed protein product [Mytilus coruscus]|uniref:Uncharacterized protein n=1 Tax=Mytilus coruscus TaxID=42192 RepID=A0A6J8AQD2_MYTCO|nr:unnamed protein product [Mytilus coruscus]
MHITSNKNCIVGAISRQQWPRFLRLSTEALQVAETATQSFLQVISNLNPQVVAVQRQSSHQTQVTLMKLLSGHLITLDFHTDINVICNFIAYLSVRSYAPSSVKSYIFGIAFKCKMLNIADNTQNFIFKQMLIGMERLDKRVDSRLPITTQILDKLISLLPFSHSFSIEAASQSSKMGFSDDEIQDFGRWESKAYNTYIRIPTLKLASQI